MTICEKEKEKVHSIDLQFQHYSLKSEQVVLLVHNVLLNGIYQSCMKNIVKINFKSMGQTFFLWSNWYRGGKVNQ